jgi:hypothetical protein
MSSKYNNGKRAEAQESIDNKGCRGHLTGEPGRPFGWKLKSKSSDLMSD